MHPNALYATISPMNEQLPTLLIILIFLEAFEIYWQKGRSTHQYIGSLLALYRRNIVLFIAYHPSFYFVLFCMMALENYSFGAFFLAGLKCLDVVFKLLLLDRLANEKHLGAYAPLVQTNQPFPWAMKLTPLVLYPTLFYLVFA